MTQARPDWITAPDDTSIFVRNVPYDATLLEFEELFAGVGTVEDVCWPLYRGANAGKFKGYAFIKYAKAEDAAKAITVLDNHELRGRSLAVYSLKAIN